MALALAAGYSYQNILKAIKQFIILGLEYAPVEGIAVDHPSWKERLERLDASQANLWKSMSAFSNGAVFLQLEQYASAERCFRTVTREFPGCYEAWADLGYAQLMQYCDKLEPEDIQMFGIGHLMVGGFYRRPASLEGGALRGIDEELWWSAVGAFREALRLKGDLVLAKANLGICYLIHPGGKDVKEATRFLQEAVSEINADSALDAYARLTVLVNAGVASMASGEMSDATLRLNEAEKIVSSADPRRPQIASLLYNRALEYSMTTGTQSQTKAVGLLEQYLKTANQSSLWWTLAYTHYEDLCKHLGRDPKAVASFQRAARIVFRPVLSLRLYDAHVITLSDPLSEVKKYFDAPETISIVPNTNLTLLRSTSTGIDIIGTEDVLAICLTGNHAPSVELRTSGVGGGKKGTIFVGMKVGDFERLVGELDYDMRELIDPNTRYRFYYGIGLALRIESGKIAEIVIAQLPTRTVGT
jgi:tetratricopeptide (TPR) repeat protein